MAANYFALPQFKVPGNAMIDFSPINNALEGMQQQQNLNRQRGDMLEQRDYQRGRDARQDQRQDKADSRGDVEWFGKQAAAVDQMQGPQRAAAWQAIIAKHPNAGSLTPDYMDPMKGPAMVAAEAGKFKDPMEQQARSLDMQYKRAQIDALNRKADDPVAAFLTDRLRGLNKPAQPAPAPQQPMLQPQSMDGGGVMPGGVTLIADQQQPGAAPAVAGPKMVDTPFGPMNPDEARQLGGAMLLNPKYATAGKAILDSIKTEGEGGLAKPTINQLEERTVSAAGTLGRLQTIKQMFKPEFLQIPNKLKLLGASWGAAFGGKLPPDMEKNLSDYAKFKAAAFDHFNQLLKEMSGTAVSAQELQRNKIVQPNPGEGLFDGDDPVSFMAKYEAGERFAKAAIARMNFMRSRGLNFNKDTAEQFMRIEDVPAAIDKRGAEIEQQLRQSNPKADPMAIQKQVDQRLKQEFGI